MIIHSFITDNDNGMATKINIMKNQSSANSQLQANTNCGSTYADTTSDDMGCDKGGADNRGLGVGGDDITLTRYIYFCTI